ncbi:major facilitator superfamily domain-containing protein 9 [Petromyzon marinus]|uniref:major facilitator superfamily domain-containing protein 9 n=1 Tax=Petromyzon marinus TaxID=7757 RepID=UPI003F6F3D5F
MSAAHPRSRPREAVSRVRRAAHAVPPLFALINSIGFLDLFGVSLVVPLLHHHLTTQLGASHLVAGLLGSVYGFLQLFSSPIVGRWSDVPGCRRRCLVLCLLSSATGYFIQGLASSPVGMSIARAVLGVSKHTQSLSRGLLSVSAPGERRPVLLGRFNAVSGLGFVVGPACAGLIAEQPGGFAALSFLCAALFLINAGIVYLFLPDPETGQAVQTSAKAAKHLAETALPHDAPARRDDDQVHGTETPVPDDDEEENPSQRASRGRCLHAARFLMSCAYLLHHGAFASWLRTRHDAPPRLVGALVSLSAAAGAATSSLARVYDAGPSPEATLRVTCAAAATAMLALATGAAGLPGAAACAVVLSVSSAVGRVVLTEGQLRVAGAGGAGATLGLGQAVTSAARVLAPALGGAAQHRGGAAAPAALGAACALVATAVTPSRAPAGKVKRS